MYNNQLQKKNFLKKYIFLVLFLFIMIFMIASFCSKEVLSPSTFFRKVCHLFKRDVGLKEKIGQMIMIGFCGTEVSENSHILRVISDVKVGGLILFDIDLFSNTFPRNILNPRQTKKLISDLQSCSSTPLFIAVDAEGGEVNRLKEKYGFFSVPSAKELGERGKVKITKQVSEKLAGNEKVAEKLAKKFKLTLDNFEPEAYVAGGPIILQLSGSLVNIDKFINDNNISDDDLNPSG